MKRALYCRGPLLFYSPEMEHNLLLVGWDSDNQTCRDKYDKDSCWIMKSSWGDFSDWVDIPTETGTHDVWVSHGYVLLPTFKQLTAGMQGSSGLFSDLQCWAYWVSGTARGLETDYEYGDSIAVGHFLSHDGPEQILIKRYRSDHLKILKYDDTRPVQDLLIEEGIETEDRIAVGDLDGDGIDEIIFGDIDDRIKVYSSWLELIGTTRAHISEGDMLAVGDVDNQGNRIIHAVPQSNDIFIRNDDGSTYLHFSAPVDILQGDAMAMGDLAGDGADEIVLASRGDRVYILDWNGTEVGPRIPVRFDAGDGLAVGDFNGDGRDEIATIGGASDMVTVFNREGTLIKDFAYSYGETSSTSAGDVNGDGRDELVTARVIGILRFNEMFG
ncbi:MAG: hypothetical protein LUO91_04935 [Methanomicrobiales archaeon]|nr:hypothetical protein [Methanomicrobiales archaeon]